MSDASTPKRKPTAKIFHVNSFVVLFSYIFLLMWQFKISIECFSSNQFDEIKHALFFKNWIQQNCFKILLFIYIIKFIWFNSGDTVLHLVFQSIFLSFLHHSLLFSSFLVCIACLHFHMLLNFEHLVLPVLDVFYYHNNDVWRNKNTAINKRNIISK